MASNKFFLLSYGCAKNRVDTEKIAGSLCRQGYMPTNKLAEAGLVIINTCAFLKEARRESWQGISRIIRLTEKFKGRPVKIIVTGCLARYYDEEKIKLLQPQVDKVFSPGEYGRLATYLQAPAKPPQYPFKQRQGGEQRLLTSSPHSVFLKIADGCDNRCAYCLIPSLRGPLVSRTMDEIVAEAKVLAELGARELTLVAQDTSAYGLDLYGKKMLGSLLRRLGALEQLAWIRVMYTHPAHLDGEILETIAAEPRICKYIDLPLQHVNDNILQHMGRGVTKKEIAVLYDKIRKTIPGVALRTTVMVGYPLEGEKEFTELMAFLRDYPFERLGAFIYSRERGTPAFREKLRTDPELMRARHNRVMEQQALVSRGFNRQLLGQTCTVLIDAPGRQEKAYTGRLSIQAPEVDGRVYVKAKRKHNVGEFVDVRISGTGNHDLLGDG